MSLIVEAMVQTLTQQVFKALMNQAEFALDFSGQFEQLKTGLDLTKALLADTESLNHKNNIVKTALFDLREVIYEADDVLTDCLVRDEYRKDGSCSWLLTSRSILLASYRQEVERHQSTDEADREDFGQVFEGTR
ncbi:hypothetical protein M0R45_025372 [Rubus argutus]|uniref:Disease resistance N-terminal domain-containing protein n=1 Tax=Rubus argutus TaxID=59490 RepID=A0AAW1WWX2_RUBAR